MSNSKETSQLSTFINIDDVTKMNGVKYDWRDEYDKSSIGVIAQEVEKIIPEVVTTNDKGLKTVSYGNLIAVLIEAIKELAGEK
jgi:hypothetical protein